MVQLSESTEKMSILDQIRLEISEIRALVGKTCTSGDHALITAGIEDRLQQVLVLATEQNMLINARINIVRTATASYADAVKTPGSNSTSTVPKHQHSSAGETFILYPTEDTGSSSKTFEVLKKKINAKEMKINVEKVKFIRNSGLAVSVVDKSSAKLLRKAVNELPEFSIKKAMQSHPFVKVIGVANDILDEEIIGAISSLTSEVTSAKTVEVKKLYETKNMRSNTKAMIFQVHPKQWKILIDIGYLNVSWHRLKIVNCVPVKRCYRCQAFGHTSKNCGPRKVQCSYCAGNHDLKTCTSQSETGRCANCCRHNSELGTNYNVNHPASSHTCNVYKSFRAKSEQMIKYAYA